MNMISFAVAGSKSFHGATVRNPSDLYMRMAEVRCRAVTNRKVSYASFRALAITSSTSCPPTPRPRAFGDTKRRSITAHLPSSFLYITVPTGSVPSDANRMSPFGLTYGPGRNARRSSSVSGWKCATIASLRSGKFSISQATASLQSCRTASSSAELAACFIWTPNARLELKAGIQDFASGL